MRESAVWQLGTDMVQVLGANREDDADGAADGPLAASAADAQRKTEESWKRT